MPPPPPPVTALAPMLLGALPPTARHQHPLTWGCDSRLVPCLCVLAWRLAGAPHVAMYHVCTGGAL